MDSTPKKRVTLKDKTFEVMIPHSELDKRIAAVADKINRDYANVDTPIFVGVLNGSFMYMADLMKKITFNCEVSFVKIASYVGTCSTGTVQELIGLGGNIEGRDVIIVEDIVDSGESIEHTIKLLNAHHPKSLAVSTMFFKPAAYTKHYEIKYPAMEIGNEFIVGFGLDYDQLGRNLADIYVICND